MFEMGGVPLDDKDLENLILEGGKHPVFEVPDDLSGMGSELSVGRKLAEESVSSVDMDMP
jgi:hypothetical protein